MSLTNQTLSGRVVRNRITTCLHVYAESKHIDFLDARKKLMLELGLSERELAWRENGHVNIQLLEAIEIALFFNKSIDSIFYSE